MVPSTRNVQMHAVLILTGWLVAFGPGAVNGQTQKKAAEPPPDPKTLVVSAALTPTPSLRYRLLPSSADLIPGNAAPIYLRAHGYEDSTLDGPWRQISEKAGPWLETPLRDLPIADIRQFVNLWGNKFQQIEFGTRRKTCDWNYTIPEQRLNVIEILLPDAQSMRQWGRLIALKERVQTADGKLEDAISTMETGLAFARHIAEGPFLINGLVGIAFANQILEPCDDLIAQPDAPNLYWALTALPRPLISLRNALELEQKILENLIPELTEAELTRTRTSLEWAVLVSRIHEGIIKWCHWLSRGNDATPGMKVLMGWDLAKFKAESLAAARAIQQKSVKLAGQHLEAISDDQIVALYLVETYRSLRDDHFKSCYLPAREALPRLAAAEESLKAIAPGPLALFAGIDPTLRPATMAELRLDRRIAVLRVIEAIRLYAAMHDKTLPETLGQITEVDVPDDPATGKPFDYRRSDHSALLSGPAAGLPLAPRYRITLRP